MCGITGWLDWERDLRNDRQTVEAMASKLALRGPDASGIWSTERVALAHRRLIVIDPEGGLQPMVQPFGGRQLAITFNGEIYNFLELRSELQALGHVFETRSDTEVLLHAYAEWGTEAVTHLNGIFAFAIWDEAKQHLFLGRDHLGVKPLFYAQRGSAFLFASEIKSLLQSGLVKAEIDTLGLTELFGMGPMRTPGHGIFKDVQELKAGHYAVVNRDGVKVRQYWKLESHEHTDDLDTTVLKVRELLEDTVRRQMISDMPLCTLLSGGLDSSGLTAIAAKILQEQGKTLKTYTLEFVDEVKNFTEDILHLDLDAPWAQKVADYWKTNHHTVRLDKPELIEHIFAPLRARDQPSAGEIETSLYLLFREMKKDATVVLSGESADEVFGGYPWFYREELVKGEHFPWAPPGQRGLLLSQDLKDRIHLDEYAQDRYADCMAEVPRLAGEDARQARSRELFYMFQTRFLSFMLDRKDRMSMATSLEVRVPFCDYRIVEYMWNVPWEMKYVDNIEKGLLRRALSHVLPHDVLYRRKTAYPVSKNPFYLTAVRDMVVDILNDKSSPLLPFIDVEKVRALTKQDVNSMKDMMNAYDHLVQINQWFKEYNVSVV